MSSRLQPHRLIVDGNVRNPSRFDYAALKCLATEFQVPDMSQIDARRVGAGVRLLAILDRVQVDESASRLLLHCDEDAYESSVPLVEVATRAILIYGRDGEPLSRDRGGPVRFYIQDHTACNLSELDACANVKSLDRIEIQ